MQSSIGWKVHEPPTCAVWKPSRWAGERWEIVMRIWQIMSYTVHDVRFGCFQGYINVAGRFWETGRLSFSQKVFCNNIEEKWAALSNWGVHKSCCYKAELYQTCMAYTFFLIFSNTWIVSLELFLLSTPTRFHMYFGKCSIKTRLTPSFCVFGF